MADGSAGAVATRHRGLEQSPDRVLGAVGEAAEMWGAHWQSHGRQGELHLPVVHGLRHGIVETRLHAEPAGGGTSLTAEILSGHYVVNRSAVFILVLGALGGLTTVLWPLAPGLLQLAPVGAVLALVAWLLVVSRLRSSDLDDFLQLVAELAEHS